MSNPTEAAPRPPARRRGSWWWVAVRVAGTAIAFVWIVTQVDLAALGHALGGLGAGALLVATFFVGGALSIGTVRWWCLLRAYGAQPMPGAGWLIRLYLIGFFYNTCVPGGVGGDVIRGIAVGPVFDGRALVGAAQGVAVAFIERLCGLLGLVLLLLATTTVWPVAGLERLRPWAASGLVIGLLVVGAVGAAPRLAASLPAPIARPLAAVPALVSPAWLGAGVVLSLFTHSCLALAGYALVAALVPGALLSDAFAIVPVSGATAFLPVSVGGAGVREAAFATLYGLVGVDEGKALAASLALFGVALAYALPSGLLVLGRSPDLEGRD